MAVVDLAKFAPPLRVGLSALPTSMEDNFEAFVNAFVTILKLGMAEVAPVKTEKVAQEHSGLHLMFDVGVA